MIFKRCPGDLGKIKFYMAVLFLLPFVLFYLLFVKQFIYRRRRSMKMPGSKLRIFCPQASKEIEMNQKNKFLLKFWERLAIFITYMYSPTLFK